MAIQLNDDLIRSVLKKSFIKGEAELLEKKSVEQISNNITTLQNAFNKIYASTLNVKNIQQQGDRRLKNIKKEITMETKMVTSPGAGQGVEFEIGNLPDVFKRLTESIEELTNNLDQLDMSQTGDGDSTDIDIDDDSKKRRRGAGRRGPGSRGGRGRGRGRLGRGLGRGVGRVGATLLLAIGADMALGAFGVGDVDEESLDAQDEKNWARMSLLNKAESIIPRGIEFTGRFLGLTNISAQAKASRIRDETKYLDRKAAGGYGGYGGGMSAGGGASRGFDSVYTPQLGSASFSARFSDYIRDNISNMSAWAMAAGGAMAALSSAYNLGMSLFDGGGGGGGEEGAGSTANAKKAMDYFMSEAGGGWTREQAAGIVGNLQAESGPNLNPTAKRENDAGAGLHSYGIAQWNRERWTGLQAFANSKGKHWSDFQTQLEYIHYELNGKYKGVAKRLRATTDAATAANLVNRQYEGSADRSGKRAANALALISTWKGSGRITSGFGMRTLNGITRPHEGVDVDGETGDPVGAAYPGKIIRAGNISGYGLLVDIDHGKGTITRYAHLSAIRVYKGQDVSAGERIGDVGNTGRGTGSHLHYELILNGTPVNPRESFLKRRAFITGSESIKGKQITAAPTPGQPTVNDYLFRDPMEFASKNPQPGSPAPSVAGNPSNDLFMLVQSVF